MESFSGFNGEELAVMLTSLTIVAIDVVKLLIEDAQFGDSIDRLSAYGAVLEGSAISTGADTMATW